MEVDVRTQYGDTADAAVGFYEVTNGPPPQSLTLFDNPIGEQVTGKPVTFSAYATGTGSSYFEYRFWMGKLNAARTVCDVPTVLIRDWSSVSTWSTNMPAAAPNYCVVAEARTKYGQLETPLYDVIDYGVTFGAKPTGVTVSANPPNEQQVGKAVTFTATGSGNDPQYFEYNFILGQWDGAENQLHLLRQRRH